MKRSTQNINSSHIYKLSTNLTGLYNIESYLLIQKIVIILSELFIMRLDIRAVQLRLCFIFFNLIPVTMKLDSQSILFELILYLFFYFFSASI